MATDLSARRADVPALHQTVRGRPLVYLDNASTTLKPQVVIDAVQRTMARECANVHRGVHALSEGATAQYEGARARVAAFLGARPAEIVFTRGTTESVNLVAQTWGRANLARGDTVVVTAMEHHSNLVPWQMLCGELGARLHVLPITDDGELVLDLPERARLVAVTHVSNVLGTINPVADICRAAHERGAVVLVDGAQAAGHLPVDVRALGCDFYALSAHKLFGPTGTGVLWGRAELLADMPEWMGGGDMVLSVTLEGATYREAPYKFEAGTPNIAGVVGLGAAADYAAGLGWEAAAAHERSLVDRATAALSAIPGVRLLGAPRRRIGIVAFTLAGAHPHDVATIVDREGIAIRSGHHCAEPLHRRLGVAASARASFAFYNTAAEVDALAAAVRLAAETFG
ncbi:MAG TPA: SufS family cysteine desulfurase [Haliangiales bacterium]|nr:SufS family cysteine desulfurase [Haliangiales bacterium]